MQTKWRSFSTERNHVHTASEARPQRCVGRGADANEMNFLLGAYLDAEAKLHDFYKRRLCGARGYVKSKTLVEKSIDARPML